MTFPSARAQVELLMIVPISGSPEITRSIHVDIRAVLWFMDAVDHADHLLTEMGVEPAI